MWPERVATAPPAETELLQAVASDLGLRLESRQAEALVVFLDELQVWSKRINLTAVRERQAMRQQHLHDCLAIVKPLADALARQNQAMAADDGAPAHVHTPLIDVGSGAGLPGLVLALLLPQLTVHCLDSVAKKVAFIQHAAGAMGVRNLQAHHQRVEDFHLQAPWVISRAFAALGNFTAQTRHLLQPGGVWLAMKSRRLEEEAKTLPADIEMFHVERLQVPDLEGERYLAWLRPRHGDHALKP